MRTHFAQNHDFALAVLRQSTYNGLLIALCFASLAASVPEIRVIKDWVYAKGDFEKTSSKRSLPVEFHQLRILSYVVV